MSEIWTPERKALAIASCKKWHGTPHQNRIAIVGVGIDCAQFVNEVLVDSGIIERREFGGYDLTAGMFNSSKEIQRIIETCLHVEIVDIMQPQFGDIPVFRNGIRSAHLGFCTEHHIWHSMAKQSVTMSEYKLWRGEIETLYRLTDIGLKSNPQQAI